MGAILDIIGSLVIRGVILTLIISLIITLRDAEYERTSVASTGQNLSVAARVMERDLKYAGYNVDTTIVNLFLIADSQHVKFLGDLDDNYVPATGAGMDTIDFSIGADPSGEPNSKVIARKVNSALPWYIAKGPVSMKIMYYDSLGAPTSTLANILSVSVLLSMKNNYPINDTLYATINREILVFPSNLQ